jgi:small conductance mechanosensitive channel
MNIMLLKKFIILLCFLTVFFTVGVSGQEAEQAEAASNQNETLPLEDEHRQRFDSALADIANNQEHMLELERRINHADGRLQELFQLRLDELRTNTLIAAVDFAAKIADKHEAAFDISDYELAVQDLLASQPQAAQTSMERHRGRLVLPDGYAPAAEQAAADQTLFRFADNLSATYKALINSTVVAERFGIDVAAEEAYLRDNLTETISNFSAFLDLTMAEAAGLTAASSAMPDDAELAARVHITRARVNRLAAVIERQAAMMEGIGLPTDQYQEQLLAATGEITAGIFDLDVITDLVQTWARLFVDYLTEQGPGFVFKTLIFFLIVYVFAQIAKLVQKALNRAMDHTVIKVSQLLRRMVSSASRNLILLVGILIAFSQIGVTLGPLLTGLGIAGFIVGFALQDSLSNFASGMMILLYRPFDVGDTIEAAGVRGKVSYMSLVNTTILTFDNQSLIIPNNKIWQDVIKNVTAQTELRVDMEFGITYEEDIDRVEKLLLEVVSADPRVLRNPEPTVKVGSFGDSSVNILCRPWVKTDDYWEVFWDLNKQVKQAFDREGITIPFPQRDVHVFHDNTGGEAKSNDDDSPGLAT